MEFQRLQSVEFAEVEDRPTDPTIQSVLSTPILSEEEVIGVIHIFTDGIHRFTNSEKRLLSVLAGLASVGIQNARLYSRVFDTEESLRRNEKLTTLGLLAAENLTVPSVTLNSNDPRVPLILDLDELTKVLVGDGQP